MPTDPTPKKKQAFLAAFEELHVVSDAAKAAGVHRSTVYDWAEKDDAFQAAWNELIERSTDLLEREAYRRAAVGVEEPVYYRGRKVGSVKRFSDTLLIFLLKSRRPDTYREHRTVRHEGGGKDGAIEIEVTPKVSKAAHDFLAQIRDAGS